MEAGMDPVNPRPGVLNVVHPDGLRKHLFHSPVSSIVNASAPWPTMPTTTARRAMRGETDDTVARSFPDRRGNGCALGIPVFLFSLFFLWKNDRGGGCTCRVEGGGRRMKNAETFTTNQLEDNGVKYA